MRPSTEPGSLSVANSTKVLEAVYLEPLTNFVIASRLEFTQLGGTPLDPDRHQHPVIAVL
jgi:hypothetical protein